MPLAVILIFYDNTLLSAYLYYYSFLHGRTSGASPSVVSQLGRFSNRNRKGCAILCSSSVSINSEVQIDFCLLKTVKFNIKCKPLGSWRTI